MTRLSSWPASSLAMLGFALFLFSCPGCGSPAQSESGPDSISDVDWDNSDTGESLQSLRLASTTSTRDSGLLDVLLPVFEQQNDCKVTLIAVGTGAALKLGRDGEADVVLVHACSAEEEFMDAGHGVRHESVMHNFFLIAGPADDPAKVKGLAAAEAVRKIAESQQPFVSRGDDSGTHKRELEIWKQAGGRPAWDGYIESGQGMGQSLIMADEKNAYILTDEGTWIKQSADFRIVPLVSGAEHLKNPYGVMVVDPGKHPAINAKLAEAFVDFLISERAQRLIADYRANEQPLFHPDRLPAQEPAE